MPVSAHLRFGLAVSVALVASPAMADLASDIQTVRDRRMEQLRTAPKAEVVAKLLAAAKPDGSFGDLNYADVQVNDSWQPKMHLERLSTLVGAYLSPGTLKDDAKIKAAVLKGIDYWLAKDYQNKNWFWNQIGVPRNLSPSLLAFWDELNADQKKKATEILGRAKIEGGGTNLVWLCEIVADKGLLLNDAESVTKAFAAIANDIKFAVKQENGAQPDSSYLYHGPLLYTWGYGSYYLREQSQIAALVAGTGFAFPEEKAALIRDWTLDGAQWLARNGAADFGAEGREIGRKGQDARILVDIGTDLLKVGAGREEELKAMVARTKGEAGAAPLVGNRSFWRADVMCHQRPGWYASARMYSARTKNTEWGNGEALRNFYVADGATVLMRDGTEYRDIYSVWDWQRVPGTTVELIPNFGPKADAKADDDALGFVPTRHNIAKGTKETFVGGVSDGQYGAFGGKFTRDALSVRRGWFFFDDEYVVLGAGLRSTGDNAVVTTIDQRHTAGPVVADVGDAGRPKWLLADGVGYAFLGTPAASVKFTSGNQTGSWHDVSIAYPKTPETQSVFKAWIEHGTKPSDAAFAYVVTPKGDETKLKAASPVAVVKNAPAAQAVWHGTLKRGGAIFYEAGAVELRPGVSVTVDRPCMVLVSLGESPSVTVSNPENEPATVKVTVTRDGKAASLDVRLPEGGKAGQSVTQALAF